LYLALRTIWDNVDELRTGGWQLAVDYMPTQGERPPWQRGSGALCSIGRVNQATRTTTYVMTFDNAQTHPALRQEVDVQFLVGITFVQP
ncbi:MAG: hypothetical protein ABIP94_10725, partial [Planctomycetota bacterium]